MSDIISGERRFTTTEIQTRSAQVAAGFQELGLQPGDAIAICLRNDVPFFEASMAAAILGCFPVQINWHSTASEVRYILDDCGAKALVIHADLLIDRRDAIPESVAVLVVETPPEIRDAYGIGDQDGKAAPGDLEWESWRDGFTPREFDPASYPATIIYTSGTTGTPKGVRRPPFGPEQLERITAMFVQSYGFHLVDDPTTVVTAIVGPTYHAAPNNHALFSLRVGAGIVVMPRFDPEELLRLIEAERITHLNMVPIMFSRLLKLPPEVRARYDLSSLQYVAHAAAPCPPDVKRAMIDWWGPVIYEYYGATETGNVTFCSPQEWLEHPGTVGKAMVGAVVKILDDDGNELPPNSIGEIAAMLPGSGDFVYHNDPDKRAGVDRDGLVAPGDIGYLDDDGYLFICDRKIDMVISGGVNIYPAEIEAALHLMPGVEDCAVFGIPDDEYGESVCAVVQRRHGHDDLSAADIQQFLRERIAGYKVPRRIDFAEDLPREDSGKIFKRKLRERYWQAAGRAV
ncbi:acyl-CoA synthetase [Mycobacterium sp. pV006]|uniref:acyl-CoA synthetase n=1 Tax=Mycobacterium sp. pV006 TaxID=3238983 RepID=UPI00351B0AAB